MPRNLRGGMDAWWNFEGHQAMLLLSTFYFPCFQTGMFITIALCLFHHCILEADTSFCFIYSHLDRKFAPGFSSGPDLDDLDDEIWDN